MLDVRAIMKAGRRRRNWFRSREGIANAGDGETEGKGENHDEQEEDTKADRAGETGVEEREERKGEVPDDARGRRDRRAHCRQNMHPACTTSLVLLPPDAGRIRSLRPSAAQELRRSRSGRTRLRPRGAMDGGWNGRAVAEAFLPERAGGRGRALVGTERLIEICAEGGKPDWDVRGRARTPRSEERRPIAGHTTAVGYAERAAGQA